jgi:peroxiredoxin family protein
MSTKENITLRQPKKLSIIAFSGDFDKLTAAFTLGTGAAAVGYEVNIFFTFWGLDAVKRNKGALLWARDFCPSYSDFSWAGLESHR